MKPKGLAKTLLGASALTAAIVVSFIAPSAHAVNAAWNTDASSGNFNTAQWSINTVPIAGGTYTVVSGDALFFGTSTTTTLNNDLVGATYNGLTFNAGASAYTIGGNDFVLNGNITNNSSNLQTINNNMTSTAARIFIGGTGGLTLGGTYTTAVAATYRGIVNITGATTISQGGGNNQGFVTVGDGINATVTISNGGSLAINGTTAGTKPNSIIANNISTSVLNVGAVDMSSSGTLTVGAETGFVLGNNNTSANGTLNINSGTATINSGGTAGSTDIRSFVALGRDTGTGTINLNGGTLATGRNFVRDGSATADTLGAANFNFAGGTLQALANQTDWLNSSTKNTNQLALTSVTATNTSTIDSNGFNVAINSNISGTGGFNITSTTPGGTVTFGGTSTYTGGTTVLSGTLATGLASSNIGLGNVTVADFATLTLGNNQSIADTATLFFGDDSTINLNNAGTETVFGIIQTDDSQSIGAGTYDAAFLNTHFGVDTFLGSGTLTVVPEPSAALLGGLGVLGLLRRRRTA
jgi:hypothetical protein